MASANRDIEDEDGEFVIIKCIDDPNRIEAEGDDVQDDQVAIAISTADIHSWNLTSILTHGIVQVKANRNRQITASFMVLSLIIYFSASIFTHILVVKFI